MERIEKKEQERNMRKVKRFLLIATLFGLLAVAAGCTAQESKEKGGASENTSASDLAVDAENPTAENPASGSVPSLRLTLEEFPHMDASALTLPFAEAVTAAVTGLPLEEARLYVLHNKTYDAYVNLIDGRADLVFAAPPGEAELAYAKDQGVELKLTPILYDAFVFFVNAKNPVDGVGLDDLTGIYSDRIKNWQELGGDDAEILACQRSEHSSSQEGMQNLVMKELPIAQTPEGNIYNEMSDIVSAVASFENAEAAIGYSYYCYAMDEQGDGKIKYLKVNGIAPDEKSVADGSYPLVSTIYIALRQDEPADSAASKLAEWVKSAEGQMLAEKKGYVPIP
jgi:phosphate transport system substrate-binding protein